MSNIDRLSHTVAQKYDEEDPRNIFLGMLPEVAQICYVMGYGSYDRVSVTEIKNKLASVIIDLARFNKPIDLRAAPRVNVHPLDWAQTFLLVGKSFEYGPGSVLSGFCRDVVGLIDNTANQYGFTFDEIVEIALKRISS